MRHDETAIDRPMSAGAVLCNPAFTRTLVNLLIEANEPQLRFVPRPLRDASNDSRPQAVSHPYWHTLPDSDHPLVFRIFQPHFADIASPQVVLPFRRAAGRAPLFFEIERRTVFGGPAEVEQILTAFDRALQEIPVHQHVDGRSAAFPERAGAWDFGHTPAMEEDCRRHGLSLVANHAEFGAIRELPNDAFEQAPTENRRAQVAHVSAEDGIELGQQFDSAPMHAEAAFLPLAHLIADFAIELVPELPSRGRQLQSHVHFVGASMREGRVLLGPFVAQFQVAHIEFIRQLHGAIDEALTNRSVLGLHAAVIQVRKADEESTKEQRLHIHQAKEANGPLAANRFQDKRFLTQLFCQNGEPAGMAAERCPRPGRDEIRQCW